MNIDSYLHSIPASGGEPTAKKRKLRKGTQSCWECKRRKARCTLTTAAESSCEGCTRRKTVCISQEFPEEPSRLRDETSKDARLDRLELVVEKLVDRVGITNSTNAPSCSATSKKSLYSDARIPSQIVDANALDVLSVNSTDGNVTTSGLQDCDIVSLGTDKHSKSTPAAIKVLASSKSSPISNSKEADLHCEISRKIIRAWPDQKDLNIILGAPGEISSLFHGTMCAPTSTVFDQNALTPREIFRLPVPGCHPLLIGRKLLLLATYLQSLPSRSTRALTDLSIDYRSMMSLLVATTHNHLTNNDDLLRSIEGIECLMVESMYQNNAGDLRSAWHLMRRAMLLAQMMGLHRNSGSTPTLFVDKQTQKRIQPNYMWFRIIQSDQCFSLMLGLPQGSTDISFADSHILASCKPLERLQRLDCLAGSYVLQRNEAGLYDVRTTRKIDELLLKASASMPVQWWLPCSLASGGSDNSEEIVKNVLRTIDKFAHYSILLNLHLPYLLRSSSDGNYNYNKITAITTARDILTHFTSFGNTGTITSFCRGINYVVFVACTALCIAHIDSHRCRQACTPYNSILSTLAHQRSSDRGAMEVALMSMKRMSSECGDRIATSTAASLTHLLSLEEHAARSGDYVANRSSETGDGVPECGGRVSEGGQQLQIHIPHFGAVNIERREAFKTGSTMPGLTPEGKSAKPTPNMFADPTTLSNILPQCGTGLHREDVMEAELRQPPIDAHDFVMDPDLSGMINEEYEYDLPLHYDQLRSQHRLSSGGGVCNLDQDYVSMTELMVSVEDALVHSYDI